MFFVLSIINELINVVAPPAVCFQELALCLPAKPELQQPSGLGEEHRCQGSVHGGRRPQPSTAGESQGCSDSIRRNLLLIITVFAGIQSSFQH